MFAQKFKINIYFFLLLPAGSLRGEEEEEEEEKNVASWKRGAGGGGCFSYNSEEKQEILSLRPLCSSGEGDEEQNKEFVSANVKEKKLETVYVKRRRGGEEVGGGRKSGVGVPFLWQHIFNILDNLFSNF